METSKHLSFCNEKSQYQISRKITKCCFLKISHMSENPFRNICKTQLCPFGVHIKNIYWDRANSLVPCTCIFKTEQQSESHVHVHVFLMMNFLQLRWLHRVNLCTHKCYLLNAVFAFASKANPLELTTCNNQ